MKRLMQTLIINQKTYTVDADPDTPLLWVIRDTIGLTGTKFGCGKGLCGSCTIHLDGIAIRSCITPLASAIGRPITTIEGLGSESEPHPLQAAWLEHNVPQCGYCQPGQLMQASSLLDRNANPTEDEIKAAMAGNICRCGTYPRILKAIKQVAAQTDADYYDATSPKGPEL